jgi:uncharacterized small protein (DUF1192 family)
VVAKSTIPLEENKLYLISVFEIPNKINKLLQEFERY